MTNEMDLLINKGATDREIADILGISINTVKSRRRRRKQKYSDGKNYCLYCGKEFQRNNRGMKRGFCSYHCRVGYWNKQKMEHEYELECENCGKTFISKGNPNKRYCSRKCYCQKVKKYEE